MKRIFSLLLVVAVLAVLTSCGDPTPPSKGSSDRIYIAIVSKGSQLQFWQAVHSGSKAAAADFDVDITFEGPPSEADVDVQIEMVRAALNKKPDALCLAALDVVRLNKELEATRAAKIPVVGFDSGIPNAPEGIIVSTASTNNYAAGELAAVKMFEESSINERISAAVPGSPVVIGIFSQDVTSSSILERTKGFVGKFFELSEGIHLGAVEISGHDSFAKPAAGTAAVDIKVLTPVSAKWADAQAAAQNMFKETKNLIGVFCANEGAVTGVLSATNEGADLDRENGIYKDIIVIGFDAGIFQKQAVKKQYFYGSITQDPFQIGYLAVKLAYKAIKGEPVDAIVDTGCKFYNYENIDNPDIAQLVYN